MKSVIRHADEIWVSGGGLKLPLLVILGDHKVSGTAIRMIQSGSFKSGRADKVVPWWTALSTGWQLQSVILALCYYFQPSGMWILNHQAIDLWPMTLTFNPRPDTNIAKNSPQSAFLLTMSKTTRTYSNEDSALGDGRIGQKWKKTGSLTHDGVKIARQQGSKRKLRPLRAKSPSLCRVTLRKFLNESRISFRINWNWSCQVILMKQWRFRPSTSCNWVHSP